MAGCDICEKFTQNFRRVEWEQLWTSRTDREHSKWTNKLPDPSSRPSYVTATELPKGQLEDRKAPRKHWSAEPSLTVLQKLADASLLSSDSMRAGV